MGSRFVYSQAMKNKTDTEVLKAFKKIYTQSQVRAIRSDNGSEFINNKFVDYLEKSNIKQILSEAGKPQSNGMIERANATIKELIQKSVELNQSFDWVKNLQKLISNIKPVAYYEVKWKGYNETTLEPREVLLKDVPKMVNQFEKKNKITFFENTNKKTGEKKQRFHMLK